MQALDAKELNFNDAPNIIWVRVRDAYHMLWSDNPKIHDIGSIITAIKQYGLQELPKFDATLNAIKAGNGRVECLYLLEREYIRQQKNNVADNNKDRDLDEDEEDDEFYALEEEFASTTETKIDEETGEKIQVPIKEDAVALPRGLAIESATGYWVMPILAGVDAKTIIEAKRYAIDSNNLTLGGDFTAFDMLKMWERDKFVEIMDNIYAESGETPVTIDADDLESFHYDFIDEDDDDKDKDADGENEGEGDGGSGENDHDQFPDTGRIKPEELPSNLVMKLELWYEFVDDLINQMGAVSEELGEYVEEQRISGSLAFSANLVLGYAAKDAKTLLATLREYSVIPNVEVGENEEDLLHRL